MTGIYKITSPTGKIYIGQSVNIKIRIATYKLLKCKSQRILFRSFKKHGFENHLIETIHLCEKSELNKLERFYQDKFNVTGPNGLNCWLTKTNDKSGCCSEETKQKIRISSIGTRIGRKHSEETKRKIGLAHIGNKHGLGQKMSKSKKELLKNLNKGNKYSLGRVTSEKQKKIHSKFMQNNKYCVNRIMSSETRLKISNGNKGKVRTEETKMKLSKARSKIIFHKKTGIYYFGVQEAADCYGFDKSSLTKRLNGRLKNKTDLTYI